MKINIYILILLFLVQNLSYSQWIERYYSPNVSLNSIFFSDESNGWSVGYSGKILHTNNGGVNWQFQNSGTEINLWSVHFVNSNVGWITGDGGLVMKTTNGGLDWSKKQVFPNHLFSVFFINSNNGFAVCNGSILKTTDGGDNWQTKGTGSNGLFSVYFITDNNGWVVGDETILRTINSGIDWSSQSLVNGGLKSVFFINNEIGWIAGTMESSAVVFKTTNSGANWNLQFSVRDYPNSFYQFNSIYFTDVNNGWVVGNTGKLYHTIDGGNNWITEVINESSHLTSVFFINDHYGWISTMGGKIFSFDSRTSVESDFFIKPTRILLEQNYPNPFNPTTKIKFGLPENAMTKLTIYDALGREVSILVNRELDAGYHEVNFDASNFTSGIYFYRLLAGDFYQTKKLILLK